MFEKSRGHGGLIQVRSPPYVFLKMESAKNNLQIVTLRSAIAHIHKLSSAATDYALFSEILTEMIEVIHQQPAKGLVLQHRDKAEQAIRTFEHILRLSLSSKTFNEVVSSAKEHMDIVIMEWEAVHTESVLYSVHNTISQSELPSPHTQTAHNYWVEDRLNAIDPFDAIINRSLLELRSTPELWNEEEEIVKMISWFTLVANLKF